jgi:hypothetical protein
MQTGSLYLCDAIHSAQEMPEDRAAMRPAPLEKKIHTISFQQASDVEERNS